MGMNQLNTVGFQQALVPDESDKNRVGYAIPIPSQPFSGYMYAKKGYGGMVIKIHHQNQWMVWYGWDLGSMDSYWFMDGLWL